MEEKLFTENTADEITSKLKGELADISPFIVTTDIVSDGDQMVVCIVKHHSGREYAHCVKMHDPKINYAPDFRGWWAEISEDITRQDNRAA